MNLSYSITWGGASKKEEKYTISAFNVILGKESYF